MSVHRGRLQGLLLDSLVDRHGRDAVITDHHLDSLDEKPYEVVLRFNSDRNGAHEVVAQMVVGADGIHSSVRASLHPDTDDMRWAGSLIWRGAAPWQPFLDARTMIIAGGMSAKLVIYPISPAADDGDVLTNWAMVRRVSDSAGPPPSRESWSRTVDRSLPITELKHFDISDVDCRGLIDATEEVYEYPMCDRDPLPWWSTRRITVLGDAAHAMYPVGSNGATQAIIDATHLASQIGAIAPDPAGLGSDDIAAALAAYDTARRPATSEIVLGNRRGGPEEVIDQYERDNDLVLPALAT